MGSINKINKRLFIRARAGRTPETFFADGVGAFGRRKKHGTRDETLPNPRAVLAVIAVPSSCATFELVDHGSLGLLALGMLSDLRMLTVTYRCCCTFRFCFYTPPRVLDFTARPFHDSTTCNFLPSQMGKRRRVLRFQFELIFFKLPTMFAFFFFFFFFFISPTILEWCFVPLPIFP
jgi:hypothetical protein